MVWNAVIEPNGMRQARPGMRLREAKHLLRVVALAVLPLLASACAGTPAAVDAVPVAERELAAPAAQARVPAQPGGSVALAEGVFRVHLSNIRCVQAPCPNGYMISNVDGHPEALLPDVPQPVSRMPQDVRFDAASGRPVAPGLIERAHVGEGIVVEGRAWLVEGGSVLRVEVVELLED